MEQNYLVIDMRRLLDESAVGSAAAEALAARFDAARAQHAGMKEQARRVSGAAQAKLLEEATSFEEEVTQQLEDERERLREQLLARANPIIRRLATERGAGLVLERAAVVMFDASTDITAVVVEEVDAEGPLVIA